MNTAAVLAKVHGMRPLANELNEATDRMNALLTEVETLMRSREPRELETELGQHVLAWRDGRLFLDRYTPDGEYIQTLPLRSTTRAERVQAAGKIAELFGRSTVDGP